MIAKGGEDGGRKEWEFGISRCKLLYIGWTNNEVLLYSTGNCIQYPVIKWKGREYKKECVIYIHPTPVLLPGKSHGQRSLVGCSPWGREESDTTERLHFHFFLSCIGDGNGNPLQCSCLENPRDGGTWWAAVYGVSQNRTRLKRLSSSSSSMYIYIYIHTHIYIYLNHCAVQQKLTQRCKSTILQ